MTRYSVENAPENKLHPLMTVTALSVTAAALATIGVMTGVIPDQTEPRTEASSAAATTFATRLAASDRSALALAPSTASSACPGCGTIETVRGKGRAAGKNQQQTGRYEIAVRLNDGSVKVISVESQPSWHAGERVKFIDGDVMPM
jgi:hypothetical protein